MFIPPATETPRTLTAVSRERSAWSALRKDARVTITDDTRLAVLIDSDNTTASLATQLLEEIAKYGTSTIKRAYGDWTTQQLVGWKEELLRHAIQPVQQFTYTRGKNSTDSALIIDAMDLLYAGNLEGFVIVSSDSDFTRLATRLRESGMTVYGLGLRKTPAPFVAACDRFIPRASQPGTARDRAPSIARRGADSASAQPEADPVHGDHQHVQGRWLVQSRRGRVYLIKGHAAFDPRDYGHTKLGELVRNEPYVEVKAVPGPTGPTGPSQLWVRLKPTARENARSR